MLENSQTWIGFCQCVFVSLCVCVCVCGAVDLWQTFEVDSLEHLEALEQVTSRLERRLSLCKASVMIVTCFDAASKRRTKRRRHRGPPELPGFLGI